MRKLAVILRVADALDRSRRAMISKLEVRADDREVRIVARVQGEAELERWAVEEKAAPLFEEVLFRGHAIQCRITAEDADRGFTPSAGLVENVLWPGGFGVRVDTFIFPGYRVPSYYDSLLAKLVVWGEDRREAIARMSRALDECKIEGIRTTLPFHERVMQNAWFRRGEVFTNFVRRRMAVE